MPKTALTVKHFFQVFWKKFITKPHLFVLFESSYHKNSISHLFSGNSVSKGIVFLPLLKVYTPRAG
jgi:hypothetical protein